MVKIGGVEGQCEGSQDRSHLVERVGVAGIAQIPHEDGQREPLLPFLVLQLGVRVRA